MRTASAISTRTLATLLTTVVAVVAAAPATTSQQLTLRGLAELAKQRAARQRPVLEEQLAPFAKDLSRSFNDNRSYLEGKFDKIAKLGPTIVPLLIEYLTPRDTSPEQAHRAENSAHVLLRLGPTTFTDALLDILRGDNSAARRHAIHLLGYAEGSDDAARALSNGIGARIEPEQLAALTSLALLKSPRGLKAAIDLVQSNSLRVRRAALTYLVGLDTDGRFLPQMKAAFANETAQELQGIYAKYLATRVVDDETVAVALLPFAEQPRLPPADREILVRAMGKIAPARHRPTIEALETLIQTGHLGRLEQFAALALRDLGEKSGTKTIDSRMDKSVKQRRTDAGAYATRGAWNMLREEWRDAAKDYDTAIKISGSRAEKAGFFIKVAQCEAHRGKTSKVKTALRNSGMSRDRILAEAAKDPVFAGFLEAKDSLQKLLRTLE